MADVDGQAVTTTDGSESESSIGQGPSSKKRKVDDEKVKVKEDEAGGTDKDQKGEPSLASPAGRLLICGSAAWSLNGRKELPRSFTAEQKKNARGATMLTPHKWVNNLMFRAAYSFTTACHTVLITEKGTAMTFGRNENGQLGLGHLVTAHEPTIVESLEEHNIVSAACGKNHTLFLTDQGIVYACGDNKQGQLGIGKQGGSVSTPVRITSTGKPIVRVACGGEFSMILDTAGDLFSFGYPEYGQLGHNSEEKYFNGPSVSYYCELTPKKITSFMEKEGRDGRTNYIKNVQIAEIACGSNHAIAADTKGRCYSWGFGGYGRLGHNETKDEHVPRRIIFNDTTHNSPVKKVYAGSTFTLVLNGAKILRFWGQYLSNGEATMYPKAVHDLSGWNVRSVGCAFKGIVAAADDSLVAWGQGSLGELGFGQAQKSSPVPKEVKSVAGGYIHEVACGLGHTVLLAQEDTDEDKRMIEKLPTWPKR